MRKEIDIQYEDKKDLLIKEKELEKELEKITEENNTLNKSLEEKENKIKELKINIDKITNALKKEEEIPDLNLNGIFNEEEEEKLKKENQKNEIDLEIKKALEDNIKKDNEINELTQKFEDLIHKKDEQINEIQIQLGENSVNENEIIEGFKFNFDNNLDLGNYKNINYDVLNIENENFDNSESEDIENENISNENSLNINTENLNYLNNYLDKNIINKEKYNTSALGKILKIKAFNDKIIVLTSFNFLLLKGINFDMEYYKDYKIIYSLKEKIKEISLGINSCLLLTDTHHILCFGHNDM